MRNIKGMVLATTLGFMVFFSLMGMGALSLSGANGQGAIGQAASYQAFWLAEAAVEKVRSSLPSGIIIPLSPSNSLDASFGKGNYTVDSLVQNSARQWTVDTTGFVNGQKRRIEAVITQSSGNNIINAVDISGNPGSSDHVNAKTIDGSWVFNDASLVNPEQQKYFLGTTLADLEASAAVYSGSGIVTGIQKVTAGTLTYKNGNVTKVTVNLSLNQGSAPPAFLIIDTGYPSSIVDINISGNFKGIVWAVGNVDLAKGTSLLGTFFGVGVLSIHDNGQGERPTIDWDSNTISQTLIFSRPGVTLWKEL